MGLGTTYAADKSLYGQDQETRRAAGESFAKVHVAQLGLFDTLAAHATSLAVSSGLTGQLGRVANSPETAAAMFAELQRLEPAASSTAIKRLLPTMVESLADFAVSSGNQVDLSGDEIAQDAPQPATIVSQANSEPASAAPGARLRLIGSGLSSAPAQASAAGTTTLGDTEVWIDQQPEPVAATLLSVDPSGIELLLPRSMSGPSRSLRVRRSGVESAPLYFTLSPAAAEFYEASSGTKPRA
jgi:hypothetical protein